MSERALNLMKQRVRVIQSYTELYRDMQSYTELYRDAQMQSLT